MYFLKIGKQWRALQRLISVVLLVSYSLFVHASCFELPLRGDDVVGELTTYQTVPGDDFIQIAEKFDVGYYNLIETNPGVNPVKTPAYTTIIIPSIHILPNTPREDIVINLAEMRVYFYPLNERKVYVYPVGIGREETGTPLGYLKIIEKRKDPIWHAPESIRKARAKDGVIIPKTVMPGPDNPLGHYALRLSLPTYLIHGTNDNSGVGRRSSSGCIRMFDQDIEELFNKAKVGTKVLVINQPVKIGRADGQAMLEVHLPLHEYQSDADLPKMKEAMHIALRGIMQQYEDKVMWEEMEMIAKEHQGIPQVITQSYEPAIPMAALPKAIPRAIKKKQRVVLPKPRLAHKKKPVVIPMPSRVVQKTVSKAGPVVKYKPKIKPIKKPVAHFEKIPNPRVHHRIDFEIIHMEAQKV